MPPIPNFEGGYYVMPDDPSHVAERTVLLAGSDRGQLTRVIGHLLGGPTCELYVEPAKDPIEAGAWMTMSTGQAYVGDDMQWAHDVIVDEV